MYIACLKDNVAVATAICRNLEEVQPQLAVYDEVVEITADTYYSMPLPSKLVDGKWEKTDEVPVVDYPQTETEPIPAVDNSVYEELDAAYYEGVNSAYEQ